MVHLSTVPKDSAINVPLVEGMERLNMGASSQADAFTTSVYGSRFAAEDLPKHEMPETEMPKEVSLSECLVRAETVISTLNSFLKTYSNSNVS